MKQQINKSNVNHLICLSSLCILCMILGMMLHIEAIWAQKWFFSQLGQKIDISLALFGAIFHPSFNKIIS